MEIILVKSIHKNNMKTGLLVLISTNVLNVDAKFKKMEDARTWIVQSVNTRGAGFVAFQLITGFIVC